MKRKHFYRIMSMILICTMLIGQLMVGEALAAPAFDDDGTTTASDVVVYPDGGLSDSDNTGGSDDSIIIIPGDSSWEDARRQSGEQPGHSGRRHCRWPGWY